MKEKIKQIFNNRYFYKTVILVLNILSILFISITMFIKKNGENLLQKINQTDDNAMSILLSCLL